jgi:hypothetical protein
VSAERKQASLASGSFLTRFGRLFIAGMFWVNVLFFIQTREGIKKGYPDFTVFYTAGTIVREGLGHQLYNNQLQYQVQQGFAGDIPFRRGPLPYIHPPFEAAIFIPLTKLPYPQAFAVWDLLNAAMLMGIGLLLRRSVGVLASIPPWKFTLASIAFFPVFDCLLQGQDSILLLLLCTLSFNALERDADIRAGCWFGLGAFKFQFIVPIILLFIIWKRRRLAIGFGAVTIILLLASVGMVGVPALLHYPEYVRQIVRATRLGAVPSNLLPNLHGIALGWPKPFGGALGVVLAALSSLLLFTFAALKGRAAARPGKLELQFSLAIAVSGLIAWQTNSHDLSLLVLPLVLLANYSLRTKEEIIYKNLSLLLPVLPLLISPLWLALWFVVGKVNLMAIPILWWAWKIGRELSKTPGLDLQAQP